MARSRALVTGGTGAVGFEVVRALRGAGVPVDFTFHRSRERAQVLAETGACPHEVDLRSGASWRSLLGRLVDGGEGPDIFVHCAGVSRRAALGQITEDDWEDAFRINVRAAFLACQALAPLFERTGGDVVLLGALDRGQSLPIPAHFAATQGALGAMAMALAKELGPRQVRANVLALGPLEQGLSRELAPEIIQDFLTFSALRRLGAPGEVARAVRWLALENRYLSGKVIPVNGGL